VFVLSKDGTFSFVPHKVMKILGSKNPCYLKTKASMKRLIEDLPVRASLQMYLKTIPMFRTSFKSALRASIKNTSLPTPEALRKDQRQRCECKCYLQSYIVRSYDITKG
jgi:hypothetical protein